MPSESKAPELDLPQAEEMVRSVGVTLHNVYLYGFDHAVTRKSMETTFGVVAATLAVQSEIVLNLTESGLLVNGQQVDQKNPLMRTLGTRMREREVNSFSLIAGMTREQFEALVDLLSQPAEDIKQAGGFAAVVTASGLQNIGAKQIVYKQVSEEDLVVSKKGIEKIAEEVLGEEKKEEEEKPAKAINVDTILAFLKGDAGGGDAAAELQRAATDAQKLADLILRAAEVRKETAGLADGESFAGLVVGCLRKAFDGMAQAPGADTQKGKRNMAKTLVLLEKQVLERLRQMGAGDEASVARVENAVEEMRDEIEMDALATEYVKKRQAMEANEKRILRFIQNKGVDEAKDSDLAQKLAEAGLTPEGWRQLLVKGGASEEGEAAAGTGGGGPPSAPEGLAAVGRLAALLTSMEDMLSKTAEPAAAAGAAPAVRETLAEVSREVTKVAEKTERRIAELAANALDEGGEGRPPKWSRAKLFTVLAEIAQELCQPLSVINCSLDMLRTGRLGAPSEPQTEMLALASASGQRLQKLVNRLMEISGMPDTTKPDESIQTSLYREGAMQ